MDSLKEQTRKDLIAFFDSQGGHTRVAERIGLSAQALRNIKIGRNDVTLSILVAISQAYPDNAEAKQLLARSVGIELGEAEKPTLPAADADSYWKARYNEVENKMMGMENKLNALATQLTTVLETNDLLKKIIKKLDPSFNQAGSQFTVSMPVAPVGFDIYNTSASAADIATPRNWDMTIHRNTGVVFEESLATA